MTYDYGDKSRGFSFEHYNFYCPLKSYCKKHNWSFIHYDFMQRCSELGQDLMTQELYELTVKERPDYLFAVLFDFHKDPRHEVFKQISSLGTVTIHWFCDDHWRFEKYSSMVAPNFDFICTTANSAIAKYKKLGLSDKVIRTQWACNHELYVPYNIEKDIDLSFVGQPHGNRVDVLSHLKAQGLDVEVFGFGWPNRPRVPFHQMIRIFSRSKINLNLSNSSTMIGQQIKGRNFEIPGSGGFLLTGNAENLDSYYKDGKEIVIFNSIEELVDKSKYYLIHDRERRIISENGYRRTLSEHTWHHRYDFIFKHISSNYNTSGDIEKLEENLLLINELRNNGLLEDAYSTLEGLIHIYPANPDLLNLQGELKFQMGQREEAKSLFLNLVRLFPENPIILNNLGIILRSEGNIEEGKSYLIKALTVDPDNRSATANLADILVSLGKYEDASCVFSSYLERNPEDKEICDCFETIKILAAGAEEERHICEKIAEINEMRSIGLLEDALSYMPDLLSLYPDSPEILNLEGELLFQAGHMEKAKKSFLSLLERFPEYGQTLNNLGVINLNEGKMDKALYYYKKAIEVNRDDYVATINLADLLVTLHKYKEAENLLVLYLERNPHVEEISSVLENLRINFINQEKSFVSVIIPCYNQAEYLPDAVESVVNQTYKNRECLIVNDGSPDNTSDVARQLIAKYGNENIRLLEKPNGGLADARNYGIENSKGEYWIPLDADDKIAPDFIEKTLQIMEQYSDVGFVYSHIQHFGERQDLYYLPDFDADTMVYNDNTGCVCSLVRKSVWKQVGGYNCEMKEGYEDWDFWVGAIEKGWKGYRIPEGLFYYRKREHTMLGDANKKRDRLIATIVLNHKGLYSEKRIREAELILEGRSRPLMKVMIACTHFWPSKGGVETIAENLGYRLVQAGYMVDIATFARSDRTFHIYRGMNIISLNEKTVVDSVPLWLTELRNLIMSGKYLACILFADPQNLLLWSVKDAEIPSHTRILIQPIINKDGYANWKDNRIFRSCLTGILKKATATIALTSGGTEVDYMKEDGIEHVYLPNAVELLDETYDFREKYGIKKDTFLILHVANLWEVKNHSGLLHSLKNIPSDWLLVMIGYAGGDLAYVSRIKEELAGRPDVLYIPGLPADGIASAIKAADVIVLSSKGEVAPVVILEAMSHRKPWVATEECGAVNEYSGGIVTSLDNFPCVLQFLKEHPDFREELSGLGYEHWQTCYSWEPVIKGWLELIETGTLSQSFHVPHNISEQSARLGEAFIKSIGYDNFHTRQVTRLEPEPLVSVIVPTYNRPGMLKIAIESILAQTYKHIEIIVVNDGETDVSNIIQPIKYNIVYVKHARNRGLAAARNTGIKVAAGKYIAYLDDDDIFYPDHIETLVNFLENNDYKVAYSDAYKVNQKLKNGHYVTVNREIVYSYDFDYDSILVDNLLPVLCLVHEKSCLDVSGLFDEDLYMHEDWDLWIRLSRNFKFGHVKKFTCEYTSRDDGTSMIGSRRPLFLKTFLRIYEKYSDYTAYRKDIIIRQKQNLYNFRNSIHGIINKISTYILSLCNINPGDEVSISEDTLLPYLKTGLTENMIYSEIHNILGVNYFNKSEKEHALNHLKKAVFFDDMNFSASKNLACLYMDLKLYDKSINILNDMLEQNPGGIDILACLGDVYMASGTYIYAEDCFEKILSLIPGEPDAVTKLNRIKTLLNNVPTAPSLKVTLLADKIDDSYINTILDDVRWLPEKGHELNIYAASVETSVKINYKLNIHKVDFQFLSEQLPEAHIIMTADYLTAYLIMYLPPSKGKKVYLIGHYDDTIDLEQKYNITFTLPLHKITFSEFTACLLKEKFNQHADICSSEKLERILCDILHRPEPLWVSETGAGHVKNMNLWKKDENFRWAGMALADSCYTVISLDFFDTLVYRLCGDPVRLFIEAGRRLMEKGMLLIDTTPEEYAIIRKRAEALARQTSLRTRGTVECNIYDIYREMVKIVSSPTEAAEIEVQVEREFCFINPSVESFVTYARKLGRKIIIISDMYLSSEHLKSILTYNGFNADIFDFIITSSDETCSKTEGKLFNIALQKLDIMPSHMIHIGDNITSDYKVPQGLGIEAIYYYRLNNGLSEVLSRESLFASNPCDYASMEPLRVLSQKLMAHLPEQDYRDYRNGAFLFGPVLARYADWCIKEFKKSGIKRVLAIMREGETFGSLLYNAASAAGLSIEIVPAFASRYSTNLASLREVNFNSLIVRSYKHGHATIRNLLSIFHIRPEETHFLKEELDKDLDTPEKHNNIITILSNSPYRELIEHRSREVRKKIVLYFKELIGEHSNIGLVDLGYHGTVQQYVEEIFRLEGINVKITGCYFSTRWTAAGNVLTGTDVRAYLSNLGSLDNCAVPFTEHPEFLEQAVCNLIGSTEGYEYDSCGKTYPVTGQFICSPAERRRKLLLQEGILMFQSLWLSLLKQKYFNDRPVITDTMVGQIDRYSGTIIHRLFGYPIQTEAVEFGSLHHDDNSGIDTWNVICDDYSRKLFREGGFNKLLEHHPYWPQGIVSMENPEIFKEFFARWHAFSEIYKSPLYSKYFVAYEEVPVKKHFVKDSKPLHIDRNIKKDSSLLKLLTGFSGIFWDRDYTNASTVLLKSTGALGDTLFLTSVVSELKNRYNHLKIYVSGPEPVEWIFRHHPSIEEILSVDLEKEDQLNPDVIVDYRNIIARFPEYYNGIGLMDIIGNIAGIRLEKRELLYTVERDEKVRAEDLLAGKNKKNPVIGIQLTTGKDIKRSYPHGKKLVKLLHKEYPDAYIIGLGNEPLGINCHYLYDCAESGISFRRQMALVYCCNAFITIDSVFFHTGYHLCHKPTLCIFGPTNPLLFSGDKFRPIQNNKLSCLSCYWQKECNIECMKDMSPAEVVSSFKDMMNNGLKDLPELKRAVITLNYEEPYEETIGKYLYKRREAVLPVLHDPCNVLPEYAGKWNGVIIDKRMTETSPAIFWEGSQFVYHSLALINRELCLQLIDRGFDVTIIPYENHQFKADVDTRFHKISERLTTTLSRSADIHVRHQWPPKFTAPPAGGHWVIIQPWEYGRLRKEWVEPMRELIDEIWIPSNFVRKSYIESGIQPEKVFVIPNGFNPEIFNPSVTPFPVKTDKKFKFLFVGGTIWRKGADVLVNAYIKTFTASDDVSLIIKDIGHDSFYKGMGIGEQLKKIQENPSMPEIIYIKDFLSEKEMAGLYTACDCLLHPYRGEGFAFPVLEAMACGKPVIVTKGGATDDFCKEEFTFHVSAEWKSITFPDMELVGNEGMVLEPSIDSLVKNMRDVYEDYPSAMEKAARALEFVKSRYTWDKIGNILVERVDKLRNKPVLRYEKIKTLMKRGENFFTEGNIDEAMKCFSSIIDIEHSSGKAHSHMATLYWKKQDRASALKHIKEAIKFSPCDADVVWNYGHIMTERGQKSDAFKAYKEYLSKNPHDEEIKSLFDKLLKGEEGRKSSSMEKKKKDKKKKKK